MINHKNNTDDFLKDFLQKVEIDSPSTNFTKNVMQKITVAPELTFYQLAVRKIKGWYLLAIVATGALVYTLYYFLNRDSTLLSEEYDPIVFPIFKKIIQSFSGLFQSMQVSSFTIVVILAILGLFLVDTLITRLKTRKQMYFSL